MPGSNAPTPDGSNPASKKMIRRISSFLETQKSTSNCSLATDNFADEKLDNEAKNVLSSSRCRLLRLIHKINFGRIEGLVIHNGEPVFDPAPKVIREIKLGARNERQLAFIQSDLLGKPQVTELLACLSNLGNGTIESLEIQHGLPFRIRIEDKM